LKTFDKGPGRAGTPKGEVVVGPDSEPCVVVTENAVAMRRE
jgi:hypothetical protein